MWTLEIVTRNQRFTNEFDTQHEANHYFWKYIEWNDLKEKVSDRIYATSDTNREGVRIGDLLQEAGSLFFRQQWRADYTITRNN